MLLNQKETLADVKFLINHEQLKFITQWEVSILLTYLLPELVLIYPWVVFSVLLAALTSVLNGVGEREATTAMS